VILQEEAFRASGMHRDFVHALPELGIFVGHEDGADTAVLRGPGTPAVDGPVDAPGRNCHIHAPAVGWVEHDGVQGQASITRHPAGPVWMIEQATH